MAYQCSDCSRTFASKPAMCPSCGSIDINAVDEEALEDQQQESEEFAKFLELAEEVRCFTLETPPGLVLEESFGLVFGNSSKQAFWGLSTQANRLSRAYEAAYASLRFDAASVGANAVLGIRFALNNSTGSSAAGIAGSSEAVMLLGTAVRVK